MISLRMLTLSFSSILFTSYTCLSQSLTCLCKHILYPGHQEILILQNHVKYLNIYLAQKNTIPKSHSKNRIVCYMPQLLLAISQGYSTTRRHAGKMHFPAELEGYKRVVRRRRGAMSVIRTPRETRCGNPSCITDFQFEFQATISHTFLKRFSEHKKNREISQFILN